MMNDKQQKKEEWKLPVIETKLRPSRLSEYIINSPIFEKGAGNLQSYLLTLLCAPPGFGKTTLLTSWYWKTLKSNNCVAWLSLDTEDNREYRFLENLSASLNRAGNNLISGTTSILQAGNTPSEEYICTVLINELNKSNIGIFIFIDDYHHISNESVHKLVGYLLKHAPDSLHLIISSRCSVPLEKLSILKSRNKLYEIQAEQLLFSSLDTREYLEKKGIKLSTDNIQQLFEQTEGWASLLHLASLGKEILNNTEIHIDKLTRKNSEIYRYFSDTVMPEVREKDRQYLLYSAVLNHFNASLLGRIVDVGELHEIQQVINVWKSHGIVVEEEDGWYRLRTLFRKYLRVLLEEYTDGKTINNLNQLASSWFEENEQWLYAARYALAAGLTAKASALVDRCAMRLVEESGYSELLNWLENSSSLQQSKNIHVQLAEVWASALMFEYDKTEELLYTIKSHLKVISSDDKDEISITCDIVGGMVTAFRDQPEVSLQIAQRILKNPKLSAVPPFCVAVLYNFMSWSYNKIGQYVRARETLLKASNHIGSDVSIITSVYRQVVIGESWESQCEFSEAYLNYQKGMQVAESTGRQSAAATLPACYIASRLYDQNKLDEAEQLLADRFAVIDDACFIDATIRAYTTLIKIAARKNDFDTIISIHERAVRTALKHRWDRMLAACYSEIIIYCARYQHNEAMEQFIGEIERIYKENNNIEIKYYYLSSVCSLTHDLDRLENSIDLLIELANEVETFSKYLLVKLHLQLSLLFSELKQKHESIKYMNLVLNSSEVCDIIGIILDAGPSVITVLKSITENENHADIVCFDKAKLLLSTIQIEYERVQNLENTKDTNQNSSLSPREMEIIKLIDNGFTNKEVSNLLEIKQETVKWHLKNIYAKLDVSNRAQAISEARLSGILS